MRTSLEKNLRPLPRTISEANRDAQYCCAIQTFKSDAKLTWAFLTDAVYGFAVALTVLSIPALLIIWLTK